MDNNNVNIPNIPNNNPQVPNQNPVPEVPVAEASPAPVEPPVVNGPMVAPPTVGNNNFSFNEEDGKILVPIGEQPVTPIAPQPVENSVQPVEQPTEAAAPVAPQSDGIMENKKMEKVEIEYTPPSGFKKFVMVFMFAAILGSIIFMPEINKFIDRLKETKEPEVKEEEVMNGTLSCSYQTNNDKYDLIYDGVFSFSNRELKSLSYTLTTKGDKVLDSTSLQMLYDSCKELSTELDTNNVGVKVTCDLTGGTVSISESIDYSTFKESEASKLFKNHSIELADFEANQNIGDIENELKHSNYICYMESKS